MLSIYSLLALAIMATFALAAPTQKDSLSKRSFTVPRVRRPGYVRSPIQAMARAYRKFGWETNNTDLPWVTGDEGVSTIDISNLLGGEASDLGSPSPAASQAPDANTATNSSDGSPAVKAANASKVKSSSSSATTSADNADESGEVSATSDDNGAEYISPITIGGQQLNLDFDTGSADLWVFSTKLPNNEIGEHNAYDPSKSSNYKQLDGYSFSLSYGDGSGAAGVVGTDTVNIGGATVTNQAIELATSVSSAFVEDTYSDGLVGLAFSVLNSVSPKTQNTFFDNVMPHLDQPVFTADLDLDGSGTYEFGTIDSSKYSGNLMFTPIDSSSGFWQFESLSYKVGDTTTTRQSASPAIADTGTSLLLLDSAVVQAYYDKIPSAAYDKTNGGYVYDCDDDLPNFAMAVGSNYMANIPGSGITYAQINSTTCFGGIQSNAGSELQILGDMLLKHHFVVFNGESEVLGMAAKA